MSFFTTDVLRDQDTVLEPVSHLFLWELFCGNGSTDASKTTQVIQWLSALLPHCAAHRAGALERSVAESATYNFALR